MANKVKTRTRVIRENALIKDEDFSGWLVVNTGNTDIVVDNVVLRPYDRLNFLDCVPPNCKWDTPIFIKAAGGEAILTQLLFS